MSDIRRAVAAELRYWAAACLIAPDDERLAERAEALDPGGAWPDPDGPPPIHAAARDQS